jgi:hypothetical protein
MYDIRNDMPPHKRPLVGRANRRYPFAEMAVGEYFQAPAIEAASIGSAAKIWKRRHPGWNYLTQTDSPNDVFRIWRIA